MASASLPSSSDIVVLGLQGAVLAVHHAEQLSVSAWLDRATRPGPGRDQLRRDTREVVLRLLQAGVQVGDLRLANGAGRHGAGAELLVLLLDDLQPLDHLLADLGGGVEVILRLLQLLLQLLYARSQRVRLLGALRQDERRRGIRHERAVAALRAFGPPFAAGQARHERRHARRIELECSAHLSLAEPRAAGRLPSVRCEPSSSTRRTVKRGARQAPLQYCSQ